MSIEDLLHRRTDLSTFLVHFTRDTDTPPSPSTPAGDRDLAGLQVVSGVRVVRARLADQGGHR
jgi:hypothetical protein